MFRRKVLYRTHVSFKEYSMPKYLQFATVFLIGYTIFLIGCEDTMQMMKPVLTQPETSVELEEPIVDFPDPSLHTAVREALGLASDDAITPEVLQTLIELDAWNREITDLTGLEYATELKVVNLHNNSINDMSPLEGLVQLTELSLSYNQISDIRPISGLTQLTALVLYGNQISDITALEGLTGLTTLGFRDNQITDIRPIAGLTQLKVLDLQGNNITDIRPIAALVNLELLFIEEDPITDKALLQSLLEKDPNLKINIEAND